ncbi:hypothetical protein VTK73DRAFT_7729 [Phialemonium thermophilum]|uniref:WSC domain-containing protein n=1 Tax=Phialemonium thermophilum TaxID=223376 RepID=A0ABR3WD67_9PEZI
MIARIRLLGLAVMALLGRGTTTAADPATPDFQYISCWSQGKGIAPLIGAASASPDMTVDLCMEVCSGWRFMALAAGSRCYCGHFVEASSRVADESLCTSPCAGDATQICGADTYVSLYSSGGAPPYEANPSTLPEADSYTYISCMTDVDDMTLGHALDDISCAFSYMSVEACRDFCNGFLYFGVSHGRECYCADTISHLSATAPEEECSWNCEGNPFQFCGAAGRLNLYKLAHPPVSSSIPSIVAPSTASSSESASASPSSSGPASASGSVSPSASACVSDCSSVPGSLSASGSASASGSSSGSEPSSGSSASVSGSGSAPNSGPGPSPSSTSPSATESGSFTTSETASASGSAPTSGSEPGSSVASAPASLSDSGSASVPNSVSASATESVPSSVPESASASGSETGSASAPTSASALGSASVSPSASGSASGPISSTPGSSTPASGASSSETGTGPSSAGPTETGTGCDASMPASKRTPPGPTISGYTYDSCWAEPSDGHALTGDFMADDGLTLEKCADFCHTWPFFGVEYGRECYCGYGPRGGSAAPETACTFPCPGDASETCGAGGHLSMYHNSHICSPRQPPVVAPYVSFHCVTELEHAPRALDEASLADDAMTLETCADFCRRGGYDFFGAEYGRECYCGNALQPGSSVVADAECGKVCGGNQYEFCGDSDRISLYRLPTAPLPVLQRR